MSEPSSKDRLYEASVSLWGRAFGWPSMRRFHNLMFNLAVRGLGVGSANAQDDGEYRALSMWLGRLGLKPIVWDVGANEGDYVAMVKALAPQAQIVAFEPNPPTYTRLSSRWAGSGVRCYQCAVGRTAGELKLWDYTDIPDGSCHATIHPAAVVRVTGRKMEARRVPVRALDDVAAELKTTQIDLLKLDVEGHELACLEGACGLLAERRIAAIQFEFNSMHLDARVSMWDFADALPGFELFRIIPHGLIRLDMRHTMLSNIYGVQNIFAIRGDGRAN